LLGFLAELGMTPYRNAGYNSAVTSLELLAEKEGGLGIVVVARAALVSGAEIEVDGGVEIVLGVKVEPVETGTAGVGFGSLHEGVGEVQSAECRADVEALDLGGIGDLRQRTEHDTSGGSGIHGGDPDGGVGRCEVTFESSAVVAHENADGFVIFLDKGEGGISM